MGCSNKMNITYTTTSDCQICLNSMSQQDTIYPILCPKQCGFNMCITCIDQFIQSSEDDYKEASDGNMAVKIHLICPNCRGNVKRSIYDTLYCRYALNLQDKADKIPKELTDSELSGNELRIKYNAIELVHEFENSRNRLKNIKLEIINENEFFFGCRLSTTGEDNTTITIPFESGFSVIDSSLFAGLEFSMSNYEQQYVTKLMVSGNSDMLAQASQILSEISIVLREKKNGKNNNRRVKKNVGDQITREWPPQSTTNNEKQRENDAMISRRRRKYPLPNRMPIHVELDANFDIYAKRCEVLKLRDDRCNFYALDELSRADLTSSSICSDNDKTLSEHAGKNDYYIPDPYAINKNIKPKRIIKSNLCNTNRVLVHISRGEAAKKGIRKNDVVTHINGEKFDGNSFELNYLINSFCKNQTINTFTIVLNADNDTAKSLKLRAMNIYR